MFKLLALLQTKFWRQAKKSPGLRKQHRRHLATVGAGSACFAIEELYPHWPIIHAVCALILTRSHSIRDTSFGSCRGPHLEASYIKAETQNRHSSSHAKFEQVVLLKANF